MEDVLRIACPPSQVPEQEALDSPRLTDWTRQTCDLSESEGGVETITREAVGEGSAEWDGGA